MVDFCLVVKWSSSIVLGFMVQNVRYLNGPPSHMTLSYEYRTPILSGIQVFGIQMVTLFVSLFLITFSARQT